MLGSTQSLVLVLRMTAGTDALGLDTLVKMSGNVPGVGNHTPGHVRSAEVSPAGSERQQVHWAT